MPFPRTRRTRTATRGLTRRLLLLALVAAFALGSGVSVAHASPCAPGTVAWLSHHATALDTVDAAAPLADVAPVRRSIGDAEIVGLGESVHGAAEELTLKHRFLRLLVERMGFRSIAWEDDWAVGRQVDAFIGGGAGDAHELVAQMSPQWYTREVVDVLEWLRAFNAGRADPVRFVGVEYYATGPAAYDAIEDHVARTAADRLAQARALLQMIRPPTGDIYAYIGWYSELANKQPYIDAAHDLLALLEDLPCAPESADRALAVQQARQIVSFYEHYDLPDTAAWAFRDARAADNLRWWRDFTGDKIVYWAASPHTANAPDLRIADPPAPNLRFPSVGSHLRRWYGDGYRSVGFTFDHGEVSLGPGRNVVASPPDTRWFERPLGEVGFDAFVIDLRGPAPAPVRRWLDAPIVTRGLPDGGPNAHMDGGTLAQWFDVLVHCQRVTPAHAV